MSTTPTALLNHLPPEWDEHALHQLETVLADIIPLEILQSRATFCRDLPTLLRDYRGRWVAYHGGQQLAIGANKTEVFQECLRRGLKRDQFLVLRIEPQTPIEVDVPLNV